MKISLFYFYNNLHSLASIFYLSEIFLTFIRWLLSVLGERSPFSFGERGNEQGLLKMFETEK